MTSFLFSLSFACSDNGQGGDGGPRRQIDPPLATSISVSMSNPSDGATNVAVTASISVTFSIENEGTGDIGSPDSSLGVPENYTLTMVAGSRVISGSLSYDPTSKTAIFTPRFPLDSGFSYRFTVNKSVLTGAEENYSVSFTTRATPILYSASASEPAGEWVDNMWSINPDGTGTTKLTDYANGNA